ncbi:unnamed protein product [Pedinophyceae sp. YPF-701]|nr:unnamed protein product [Pedinophyceae sp. YPF-701]
MSDLFQCAKFDKADEAAQLVASGADVNATGEKGRTPLIVCGECGSPEVAKLLLDKGADVNAQDDDGKTALHLAADAYRNDPTGEACREAILDVLVNTGGAVCLFDGKGKLPDAGEDADFLVVKMMDKAEAAGKEARKQQGKQRAEMGRQALQRKQKEYQESCSDALVAVMDSGSHEGYKHHR